MIRRLRANLLDELQKQYYVTALAKGLPRRRTNLKRPAVEPWRLGSSPSMTALVE